MQQGWIKLHRQIIDWEWYTEPNTFRVFFHLLLNANHEPCKWKGVEIKKGERVTSLDHLAKELSLSVSQIRLALKHLKTTGEITSKSTNTYTIITIKNYGRYQEDGKQDNKPTTSRQQTDNKRITTNKNEENDKNISKDIGDKSSSYGNKEINQLIKGVNKHLPLQLPEDGKSRIVAGNILKMITKLDTKGNIKKDREFLKDDKWENMADFMAEYNAVKLSNGYNPQSWYKVYDNFKLWIANKGKLVN
jgi:hypothetical protein